MKNKKGFTLIELLAIIVILAIIAVITVPIILNIIENSKKGAASDSAYGFKDAVNKAYVTKLSENSDYNITDGTYTVSDLKTQIGLSLSGKEPGENSWVTITKNNVTTGCLQYDDFKVEFTDGKVSNTEKGTCEIETSGPVAFIYASKEIANSSNPTTKTLENSELGDYVKIDDDGFYIVGLPQSIDNTIPTYNKVLLLAEYNISNTAESGQPIAYRQRSGSNFNRIKFSESYYWENCVVVSSEPAGCDTVYRKLYSDEIAGFIYNSSSNLFNPMENYKNYLENKIGTEKISKIRPMSEHEALEIGCTRTGSAECPTYSHTDNQSYWLGTDDYGGTENSTNNILLVNPGGLLSNDYYGEQYLGIRPLLEISISAF